ncbi:glycosyltransferase family 4 protein [Natronobiforma cellulositropha]|uniref:glycosyltransferase family 4 protein n=1 Tax=Natronobiforma cellulositropha TaxID=1679076 RepID=UPI0021D57122|nr:glycosyltransferase family 4 protein [Natronobiforma cellulositropha]
MEASTPSGRADGLSLGLVVPGPLETRSGGYRYDRQLVSQLRARGDAVEVIDLSRYDAGPETASAGETLPRALEHRLNRPFDALVQDELCAPTLGWLNPHLERPHALVALVHHLRSAAAAVPGGDLLETERRYLESVDATVCVSEATRRCVEAYVSRPTLVAPPGGRVGSRATSRAAVAARATDDPLRLLFVGALLPRKGVVTLLEGLLSLRRRLEPAAGRPGPVHLTLVGDHRRDPAYARRVLDSIDAFGLEADVTVTGEVSSARLVSLLSRAHVLVAPSRYEGFGMVALEAMEHGVVPVVSAAGGARELVDDGENGLLVPPADPDAISELLAWLARDRSRLARLGGRALETADAHPDWPETADDVRSFLRSLEVADTGQTRRDPSLEEGEHR